MEQTTTDLELHRLRAEFDADRKAREEANRKEASFIKATGWSTSLIVAIFLGIQIYNSVSQNAVMRDIETRTDRLVTETERKVEDYLRGSVPDSASITSIGSADPDMLTAVFTLQRHPTLARLEIRIEAQAVVHGATPGRLLGYEVRYSRALAELLASAARNQESRDWTIRTLTSPRYFPIAAEAVPVAPEVGFWITNDHAAMTASCRDLAPIVRGLRDPGADFEAFFRPIVEHVATPTREARFGLSFVDNSIFPCTD
ncbi:hypothetical protein [Rhodovulum euryhalinum]|uniref:Uncharacterized protein n=1 Tax=Rhodovulum euryhalinum TaxID=35805 RepID=A0A4R2KPL7_9RHOB|nr:hypothetical protein [Rhodovulum euryhalinum]TCO72799.1 hypothetical protein EV655_10326 [Rhodovulum euryhalinum]